MLGGLALFAGGVLFGTAGVKILGSKDAKKVYTHVTAAALRGKDEVMDCVTKIREEAGDIYEDAKTINEERAAADEEEVLGDYTEVADDKEE